MFASDGLVNNCPIRRKHLLLDHPPRCIISRKDNFRVRAVRPLSSRHKEINDKTVIYRNGRIRLDTIIVAKTNS